MIDKIQITEYNENRNKKREDDIMFRDYPATQLFLISLVVLLSLVLITPLVREWHIFAALLDSLNFIVKIICGFFLFFMIIDIVDNVHTRKQKHIR